MNPSLSANKFIRRHWLTYQSNELGQAEIYVRPFPGVNGGRWQVSTGGRSAAAVGAKRTRDLLRRPECSGADGGGRRNECELQQRNAGESLRSLMCSVAGACADEVAGPAPACNAGRGVLHGRAVSRRDH